MECAETLLSCHGDGPFGLILRVAVQRSLDLALGEEKGRVQYKFLMCRVLAELLVDSVKILSPRAV